MSVAAYALTEQQDGQGAAVLIDNTRGRAFGPVFYAEVYAYASGEPLYSPAEEVAEDFIIWCRAVQGVGVTVTSETLRPYLDALIKEWRVARKAEQKEPASVA